VQFFSYCAGLSGSPDENRELTQREAEPHDETVSRTLGRPRIRPRTTGLLDFRVGGYSTGTENFRTERLDEHVGDCVNSTAFPATSAFFGTDPSFVGITHVG
jgi:hypothetical protein